MCVCVCVQMCNINSLNTWQYKKNAHLDIIKTFFKMNCLLKIVRQ